MCVAPLACGLYSVRMCGGCVYMCGVEDVCVHMWGVECTYEIIWSYDSFISLGAKVKCAW